MTRQATRQHSLLHFLPDAHTHTHALLATSRASSYMCVSSFFRSCAHHCCVRLPWCSLSPQTLGAHNTVSPTKHAYAALYRSNPSNPLVCRKHQRIGHPQPYCYGPLKANAVVQPTHTQPQPYGRIAIWPSPRTHTTGITVRRRTHTHTSNTTLGRMNRPAKAGLL